MKIVCYESLFNSGVTRGGETAPEPATDAPPAEQAGCSDPLVPGYNGVVGQDFDRVG